MEALDPAAEREGIAVKKTKEVKKIRPRWDFGVEAMDGNRDSEVKDLGEKKRGISVGEEIQIDLVRFMDFLEEQGTQQWR